MYNYSVMMSLLKLLPWRYLWRWCRLSADTTPPAHCCSMHWSSTRSCGTSLLQQARRNNYIFNGFQFNYCYYFYFKRMWVLPIMHSTFTRLCFDFLVWAVLLVLQHLDDDGSRACLMTFDLKAPPLHARQLTRAPWRPVCQVTVAYSRNIIEHYTGSPKPSKICMMLNMINSRITGILHENIATDKNSVQSTFPNFSFRPLSSLESFMSDSQIC